jgi:hypothetical protein
MESSMKKFDMLVKITLIVGLVVLMNLNKGCKEPSDYEPQDTLVAPPGPPQPLAPEDSAVFVVGNIYFEWSKVSGVDFYEIAIDQSPNFNDAAIYKVYTHSATIGVGTIGIKYWRVRAYSPYWTWYTSWSPSRCIIVKPEPD